MLVAKYARGTLTTSYGAQISYITMGEGPIPLVIIPGVGDGIQTVEEAAPGYAWTHRNRASQFRMLILSRRQPIPLSYSIEEHANDMIWAMEKLQWGQTMLEGISLGGPIAQWIAVKRPQLVRGLVLTSTMAITSKQTRTIMKEWLMLAQQNRWADFNWSRIAYTSKASTANTYQMFRPFLGILGKPKHPGRFERILEGLLYVDNHHVAPLIRCPTLVLGGTEDRFVNPATQQELARMIPQARMKLFPGEGHNVDQDNASYLQDLDAFAQDLKRGTTVLAY